MPYLKIQTNQRVSKKAKDAVLKEASVIIAQELEKPEDFVMIAIQPETAMIFAGTHDPVAFLELKGIGLTVKKAKPLSGILCEMIEDNLGIPKDRVYVKFIDVNPAMWGWKGDTF